MAESPKRYHDTVRLTVASAILNVSLALIKLIVGFLGHSQALVADGIHSFSDLLTDGIIVLAAKASNKAPDEEHPYGHGRIETAATIVVGMVLLMIGLMLFIDVVAMFAQPYPKQKPAAAVLLIALLAIGANEAFYRISQRINQRWQSPLIESNALHHRSDAYTSIIVLLAAGGAMLRLPYLDAIGAAIIALLILNMALRMMLTCFEELIDTGVDQKTRRIITEAAEKTPGVKAVHALRTRTLSKRLMIDIHVIVSPDISVSEGHFIGDQVQSKLHETLPQLQDAVVHIDAEDDEKTPRVACLPDRATLIPLLKPYLPEDLDRIDLHYLDGHVHLGIYMHSTKVDDAKTKAMQALAPIGRIHYFHTL